VIPPAGHSGHLAPPCRQGHDGVETCEIRARTA
jgi:hypothetical protein